MGGLSAVSTMRRKPGSESRLHKVLFSRIQLQPGSNSPEKSSQKTGISVGVGSGVDVGSKVGVGGIGVSVDVGAGVFVGGSARVFVGVCSAVI